METETGVWKPEVGGKAWRMISNSFQVNVIEVEIIGINHGRFAIFSHSSIYHDPVSAYSLHETAEKAILAGVKVINLEGKEVVLTRAEPIFDDLETFLAKNPQVDEAAGNLWEKLKKEGHVGPDAAARIEAMAAGNEDPAYPSAREITTPTDKRNGDHC